MLPIIPPSSQPFHSRAGPASLRLRFPSCCLNGVPVISCANTALSEGCGLSSKINLRNFPANLGLWCLFQREAMSCLRMLPLTFVSHVHNLAARALHRH